MRSPGIFPLRFFRGAVVYTQQLYRDTRRRTMTRVEDLTGRTFGHLYVIQQAYDILHRKTFWACECECGGVVYVSGTNLRRGYTTRCRACAIEDRQQVARTGDADD